jgi:ubiquitin-activating enzyme E1 C
MKPTSTLNELIQTLRDGDLRLKSPSLTSGSGKTLYMQKPPALEKATRPNLDKAISSLIQNGEELVVTDTMFPDINLTLLVSFGN